MRKLKIKVYLALGILKINTKSKSVNSVTKELTLDFYTYNVKVEEFEFSGKFFEEHHEYVYSVDYLWSSSGQLYSHIKEFTEPQQDTRLMAEYNICAIYFSGKKYEVDSKRNSQFSIRTVEPPDAFGHCDKMYMPFTKEFIIDLTPMYRAYLTVSDVLLDKKDMIMKEAVRHIANNITQKIRSEYLDLKDRCIKQPSKDYSRQQYTFDFTRKNTPPNFFYERGD